jgi:hypothetical protein
MGNDFQWRENYIIDCSFDHQAHDPGTKAGKFKTYTKCKLCIDLEVSKCRNRIHYLFILGSIYSGKEVFVEC